MKVKREKKILPCVSCVWQQHRFYEQQQSTKYFWELRYQSSNLVEILEQTFFFLIITNEFHSDSIKRQIVFIYHDPKFCVSSLEIHFFLFQKKMFSITCCKGICIFCSMLSAYILQKLKNDPNSLAYSLYDVINDCPRAFYWAWLPCKRVCLAIVRTCAQLDRLREEKKFGSLLVHPMNE